MDIIENSYSIPFVSTPCSMLRNNNKSAFDNSDFETEAVLDFLKSGCIEEVKIKPIVVNPLTVSIQKLGKRRTHFRFERGR